jgi:hypothetical protein
MTAFPVSSELAQRSASWHDERLALAKLSGRCGFGERAFSGAGGNEKVAPIPDAR